MRKRKVRAGHRISTRKIISSVEEILETFEKQDQPSAIVTTAETPATREARHNSKFR